MTKISLVLLILFWKIEIKKQMKNEWDLVANILGVNCNINKYQVR